ncbi:lysM domain receptor-like kinase 4 [Stylosanthes scabra]|uniref:LysM domain receptor-like kinase 4 n=1 Tax=Stylosanthes scabra TaxID=79078 RepID=A0ABU6Z5S5_9FABA|nr:lysM domain receptor-like kinase 4 [Stylosanthes scabra]
MGGVLLIEDFGMSSLRNNVLEQGGEQLSFHKNLQRGSNLQGTAGGGPASVDGKFLNWRQRIQIALDVAIGFDYLRNFTSPPYIHKDLKCGNILLDSDLRAKVAKDE